MLLKIAPDLTLSELDDVVGVARRRKVDGMIVGNTTMSRPPSLARHGDRPREAGGLSGKPLFPLATRMLAETFVRAEGAFPLIGVGGIDSAATALAKFRAGASLLQLYTGLVFRGLGLVGEIKAGLLRRSLGKNGIARWAISSAIDAAAITARAVAANNCSRRGRPWRAARSARSE